MWVATDLDPETHALVAEYASKRGMRISSAIAELITIALEMKDEDTPRYRLWRAVQRARQQMQDFIALQQVAVTLNTSSAEEQNEFATLCEQFGFDESEVLRSVEGIDVPKAPSETVLRSVALLRDCLQRNGGEALAVAAERELRAAGLSQYAITQARRALGVVSVRGRHGFIWRLPEEVREVRNETT